MTTKEELKYVGLGILLIWLCVLLMSCGPRRVEAKLPPGTIKHETWFAVILDPTANCQKPKCETFWVYTRTPRNFTEIQTEICKNKNSYFCMGPDPAGQVVIIERRRK